MHKSKRWPCHSQDRLMLRLLLPMRSGDALPDAVVVVVLLVHILLSIVIVAVVDVVFVVVVKSIV